MYFLTQNIEHKLDNSILLIQMMVRTRRQCLFSDHILVQKVAIVSPVIPMYRTLGS